MRKITSLTADIMVLGTPVYFNNVSAQLKAFMDRTWNWAPCLSCSGNWDRDDRSDTR